mgnify:CR=1 FL=1
MKKILAFATFVLTFLTGAQAITVPAEMRALNQKLLENGIHYNLPAWGIGLSVQSLKPTIRIDPSSHDQYQQVENLILSVSRPEGTADEQLFKVFSQAVAIHQYKAKEDCRVYIAIDWIQQHPCRIKTDGDAFYFPTTEINPFADNGGENDIYIPSYCAGFKDEKDPYYYSEPKDFFLFVYKYCPIQK